MISDIREVHDKIPKKRKKLKPNEMKLILNWKLAGEAEVGLQIKKIYKCKVTDHYSFDSMIFLPILPFLFQAQEFSSKRDFR